MAEINEVFDDMGESIEKGFNNIKKKFKDKPFLWLCLGVALIALWVYFTKDESSGSAETGGEYYYPTGYSGYPTVDGYGGGVSGSTESSDYTDIMNDYQNQLDQLESAYQQQLEDMEQSYADKFGNLKVDVEYWQGEAEYWEEERNYFYDENKKQQTTIQQQTAAIEAQQILAAMKSNSELYNQLSGAEYADKRAQLHAENLELASYIGATYDDKTGAYYIDGQRLYSSSMTQAQELALITGKGSGSSGGGSTVKNTDPVAYDSKYDYQKAIIEQLNHNGPVSSIEYLNAQRNAKIAASGKTTAQANTAYDKNVDYQAAIDKAKAIGASQEVIDNLAAQREAKIKGENLTQYMK